MKKASCFQLAFFILSICTDREKLLRTSFDRIVALADMAFYIAVSEVIHFY